MFGSSMSQCANCCDVGSSNGLALLRRRTGVFQRPCLKRLSRKHGRQIDLKAGGLHPSLRFCSRQSIQPAFSESNVVNDYSPYKDEGPRIPFNEIEVEGLYEGVVVSVTDYGVFVDISSEKDCLVHVSELSVDYVVHPSDVAEVGMPVTLKIINKDSDRRVLGGTFRNSKMNIRVTKDELEEDSF